MNFSKLKFAWWIVPISSLIIVAFFQIGSSFLEIDFDIWQHLIKYVLPLAVWNTIGTLFLACVGVIVIGVSSAWLVSNYQFWGRSFFSWAMIMPMAIPPYIMAIVYIDAFDYSGFLQNFLRNFLQTGHSFWHIRSWWGLTLVLSLSFYPYIYLFCRSAFLTQGQELTNVARSLGVSRWRLFLKLTLPMSKPWILAGLYLMAVETLSDFGTFSVFGIDNLTTTIYKAWFGLFNHQLALQISSLLLFIILIFWQLSKLIGRRRHFTNKDPRHSFYPLTRHQSWLAIGWLSLIFGISFLFPVVRLIIWVWQDFSTSFNWRYLDFAYNSLTISLITASITVFLGLILTLARHYRGSLLTRWWIQVSILGYATPSVVLAVALYVPFIKFDFWLSNLFGETKILGGTLLALVFILCQRFLSPAYQNTTSMIKRISANQGLSATTFGASKIRILIKIYLPALRNGLLTGFLLVFMDVMKELPITLITRPFGWDTLAVRVFEMTSSDMFERAAFPSLCIVLISSLVIIVINKSIESNQYG
ncbi:MAG: iron ABC transporter permease [SAR324 cluster bacterium]|nr:iron ABC transporter permease [SAR324 cluster bacterium]